MASQKSNDLFSDEKLSLTVAITTALVTSLFVIIGSASYKAEDIAPSTRHEQHTEVVKPPQSTPEAKPASILPSPTTPDTQLTTKTEAAPPVVSDAIQDMPRTGSSRYAENMRLDLPHLAFEARFPTGSSQEPAYSGIMEKISGYRERLNKEAEDAKNEYDANNMSFNQWDVDIVFRETARSGNVVSAMGREYSYTGGAHPNLNWQGLISKVDTGDSIALYDLFKPRVGLSPALAIAACQKIKQAKIERIGEATIDGDPIDCASSAMKDRIFNAETALTSSNSADKFGGVFLMFAPYELGPYVEGPYTVIVDQSVFYEDLRPNYKTLFAGEAVRPHTD